MEVRGTKMKSILKYSLIILISLGIYLHFSSTAKLRVAMTAFNFKENKIAFIFFNWAATQDEDLSQYMLGYMYKHGIGVRQNLKKSIEWFTQSADNGNSIALLELGEAYVFGYGVVANYETAQTYYKKSCDLGDELGCRQYNIVSNMVKNK